MNLIFFDNSVEMNNPDTYLKELENSSFEKKVLNDAHACRSECTASLSAWESFWADWSSASSARTSSSEVGIPSSHSASSFIPQPHSGFFSISRTRRLSATPTVGAFYVSKRFHFYVKMGIFTILGLGHGRMATDSYSPILRLMRLRLHNLCYMIFGRCWVHRGEQVPGHRVLLPARLRGRVLQHADILHPGIGLQGQLGGRLRHL